MHGRKRGGREGAQHERARTRRKARGKRAAIAGDAPEGLRGEGRRCAQTCASPIWTFADQSLVSFQNKSWIKPGLSRARGTHFGLSARDAAARAPRMLRAT